MCLKCGRVYNTQFTQAVHSVQQTQQVTPSIPIAAYGPKDRLEWNVSTFWHWLGLFLTLGFAVTGCWSIIHFGTLFPIGTVWSVLAITLAIFGASFCALRLRRLYVYFTNERRPWWISAFVVVLLIAVPIGSLEYFFQISRIHAEEDMARYRFEEQQRQERDRVERIENARIEQERQERQNQLDRSQYAPPTYYPSQRVIPTQRLPGSSSAQRLPTPAYRYVPATKPEPLHLPPQFNQPQNVPRTQGFGNGGGMSGNSGN